MESNELAGNVSRAHLRPGILAMLGIAAMGFGAVVALNVFAAAWWNATRINCPSRRKAPMDIASICAAVDSYSIANGGRAPESLEVLVTPDANGNTYLKNRTTIPNDPWNNPYGYELPSSNREYRVFSLGRDGQPGGIGDNADIDNFTIVADHQR